MSASSQPKHCSAWLMDVSCTRRTAGLTWVGHALLHGKAGTAAAEHPGMQQAKQARNTYKERGNDKSQHHILSCERESESGGLEIDQDILGVRERAKREMVATTAVKVALGAVVANLIIWIALVGGPSDFYEARPTPRAAQRASTSTNTNLIYIVLLFFFLFSSFFFLLTSFLCSLHCFSLFSPTLASLPLSLWCAMICCDWCG